ncbi:5165_t:CDS:2, partial [Acaulospora morrowiae]
QKLELVPMVRKDKKNRTCNRCGKTVATPQKLREHLERKNPCRPINQIPEIVSETRQVTEVNNYDTHQTLPVASNSKSEIKGLNDRLPGETVWKWAECKSLYDELLQMDDEAYDDIEPIERMKEEQEFFGEVEDETNRQVENKPTKNQQSKNLTKPSSNKDESLINKEFERLSMITGDNERDIIFREQNMGPALKRRVVAVHNAKVSRYHPDNGSDIRKILESQRKPFRELLEKEFDKRGQFKFALCSLTKFLVDNKPGEKEKDKKKNTRMDWLRNKQIIVYNRAEIDDYLSNAFEQIINQVEERGGKSNA